MAPLAGASSYREILRASVLIGGASLVVVLIGMLRTKALALLLGPAGYGLFGAYGLILDLTRTVAQFGLNASGVKEIAAAASTADDAAVARTAATLRRVAVGCGIAGGVALAALAAPVARFSFGGEGHAGAVALLALAVPLAVVAGARDALMQGLRRVGDLARAAVHGAALGAVLAVACVAVAGPGGVVPALVAMAAGTLAMSWFYSRRVALAPVELSARQTLGQAQALLQLGFAFMASGLLTVGAAYLVRVLVLRGAGLEAAGLYGAAWTVGGLYVGFILQALGVDFYPRLVGAGRDDARCNRLVNEQTEVGLLLALPGVVATLALAPLVLTLFFSAAFAGAVETLRWICLGMALRVLSWPLGYVVVARDRRALFLAMEATWCAVNVGLSWFAIARFGVEGAGIGFFGAYVVHAAVVWAAARRVSGFRWADGCLRTVCGAVALVAAVVAALAWLPPPWGGAVGALATVGSGLVCLRLLLRLLPDERLPRALSLLRWSRP